MTLPLEDDPYLLTNVFTLFTFARDIGNIASGERPPLRRSIILSKLSPLFQALSPTACCLITFYSLAMVWKTT